jgi:hypothetical protein
MDAFATHVCLDPEQFDVVVCPNLAGDVLSDLAAGLVGGLGLLPSANIGSDNALFEPVHGTAPDIAGEGVANPSATILSAAMLLEHLGYDEEGTAVREAVESTLSDGPRTPDLGGDASTEAVTEAVEGRSSPGIRPPVATRAATTCAFVRGHSGKRAVPNDSRTQTINNGQGQLPNTTDAYVTRRAKKTNRGTRLGGRRAVRGGPRRGTRLLEGHHPS